MQEDDEFPGDDAFSNDPEENLRLENEFLKLKMMAESGAHFGETDNDLSPGIENAFLKSVLEFEKAYVNSNPQKVFDILGKPAFNDEKNLDDEKFTIEFERLKELLLEHSINVDFIAEKSDRLKYDFIIKELFNHETEFLPLKGMTTNFIYEEFHPDHKQEITDITYEFINDFFERKLNADTAYIGDEFVEPNGNILSRGQLMENIHSAYDVFAKFENNSFTIDNVEFELKNIEGAHTGMGFSEGEINYDIIFKDAARKEIRGPFKIYFIRQLETWTIYFFYLAGLNYNLREDL